MPETRIAIVPIGRIINRMNARLILRIRIVAVLLRKITNLTTSIKGRPARWVMLCQETEITDRVTRRGKSPGYVGPERGNE
jgi:hypothetical protein